MERTPPTAIGGNTSALTATRASALSGCTPAEVEAFLSRFLTTFNRGDLVELKTFFPTETVGQGNHDFAGVKFEVFSMTDQGVDGNKRHFAAYDLPTLWAYLAERHTQHERLGLDYLAVSGQDTITVSLIITLTRIADDLPANLGDGRARGKVIMNCRDQTIRAWNFGQGSPATPTPGR